jgi:hypothetical protein
VIQAATASLGVEWLTPIGVRDAAEPTKRRDDPQDGRLRFFVAGRSMTAQARLGPKPVAPRW